MCRQLPRSNFADRLRQAQILRAISACAASLAPWVGTSDAGIWRMAPLASIKFPIIASVGFFIAVAHSQASFSEMVIGVAFIALALLLLSGALHRTNDAEQREDIVQR